MREMKYLKNYLKLEMAIRMKESYLISTTEDDRCIGKTYSLVELALEYGLPILVKDRISERYIKELAKKEFNVELRNVFVLTTSDSMRRLYYDIFLVDEGVDIEVLYILREHGKNIIGYMYEEK